MTRQDRNTRIAALWAKGVGTTEIAARLGLTKNAVIGAAYRMRAKDPSLCPVRGNPAEQQTTRAHDDRILKAMDAVASGAPVTRAAAIYGVHDGTLANCLKEACA